ncbi:hypothetical protein HZS_7880 [Henneguya salminicola]|nr:hypothetical protein HZS_7880 [Henneguya salminicola]
MLFIAVLIIYRPFLYYIIGGVGANIMGRETNTDYFVNLNEPIDDNIDVEDDSQLIDLEEEINDKIIQKFIIPLDLNSSSRELGKSREIKDYADKAMDNTGVSNLKNQLNASLNKIIIDLNLLKNNVKKLDENYEKKLSEINNKINKMTYNLLPVPKLPIIEDIGEKFFCKAEHVGEMFWKNTNVDETVTSSCPFGMSGTIKRKCAYNSQWLLPDFSLCYSHELNNYFVNDRNDLNYTLSHINTIIQNRPLVSNEIIQILSYLDQTAKISLDLIKILNVLFSASNVFDSETFRNNKTSIYRLFSVLNHAVKAVKNCDEIAVFSNIAIQKICSIFKLKTNFYVNGIKFQFNISSIFMSINESKMKPSFYLPIVQSFLQKKKPTLLIYAWVCLGIMNTITRK